MAKPIHSRIRCRPGKEMRRTPDFRLMTDESQTLPFVLDPFVGKPDDGKARLSESFATVSGSPITNFAFGE